MLKKDYEVSIIIPIYNAKNTLERAIVSVMNQTIGFDNIELILVDDNSSDDSKEIINSFSTKHENIIPIFLQKNSGWASKPRNVGMKESSSPLIMFMDSDDEYSETMCETMVNTIKDNDCDLVSCDCAIYDPSTIKEFNHANNDLYSMNKIVLTGEECLSLDFIYVWNKIFKKSIIQKKCIEFPESISEDFIFCIEYLININKRIHLKDYYGYIKHEQQVSLSIGSIGETDPHDHIQAGYHIFDLIQENVPNISEDSINCIFEPLIHWIVRETMNLNNKKIIINSFKDLKLFEEYISFSSSFDSPLTNLINHLVMSEKWRLILKLYDLMDFSRNNRILLKIYQLF